MELPPVLTRRLTPKGLYALDAVAALVISMISWAGALEMPDHRLREPFWVSTLAAVGFGLAVALRRRWIYPVAIAVTIMAVISLATQIIPAFAAFGPAFALALVFYMFGVHERTWRGWFTIVGCAALVSASMVASILMDGAESSGDTPSFYVATLFGFAAVAPAQTLGFAIGERRAQASERNRLMVQRAAVEERLRVARELHDVIAHTMTLIVVKASIGNHVAEADPAEARDALRVIEATGRTAMLEVRRVLDILREDTPYAPSRGLDDLPALAEQASVAGVRVRLDIRRPEGAADAGVPEAVGLAVYRIVQEAITNVVKHATPAQCDVSVVVSRTEVRVEVNDDGKRPPRSGTVGHGLIGMRERVMLHGGTFHAGPRSEGGFCVRALFPVEGVVDAGAASEGPSHGGAIAPRQAITLRETNAPVEANAFGAVTARKDATALHSEDAPAEGTAPGTENAPGASAGAGAGAWAEAVTGTAAGVGVGIEVVRLGWKAGEKLRGGS